MRIYAPFNDKDLVGGATRMTTPRGHMYVHGTPTASLREVGARDTLYVIGHGRYSRGDQICGEVAGHIYGTRMVYLTAKELTSRLVSDGLTKRFGDLRLMMCWGGYGGGSIKFAGHDLTRDASKPPFAGQLCSAMKDAGFNRIIVTGYTGEVMYPKERGAVPTGIWLNNKSDNLIITNDDGERSLLQLLGLVGGSQGTLSDVNRTVWY